MKRCGVTRRETTERMEYKKTKTESDTGEGLQRIQLWTTAMQSLTEEALHGQLLMVHFLHIKKPIKQRLVQCPSTTLCLSLSLSSRIARERETFENHTAIMLLRSSAPKRRLNKAVKKLIPLGRHACKHTDTNT